MPAKETFTEKERFGLSKDEVRIALKYLRANRAKSAIPRDEALPVYEWYLSGYSFTDIAAQFPKYPLGQIIMTAAIRGWAYDRTVMMTSIESRVRSRIAKAFVDQVEFLTLMMSVTNAQHRDAMKAYILDPKNNPLPDFKIGSLREYRDLLDILHRLMLAAQSNDAKSMSLYKSIMPGSKPEPKPRFDDSPDEPTISINDVEVDDDEEDAPEDPVKSWLRS